MLQRESNKTQGVVTSPLSRGRQAWESWCSEGVSLRLSPTWEEASEVRYVDKPREPHSTHSICPFHK